MLRRYSFFASLLILSTAGASPALAACPTPAKTSQQATGSRPAPALTTPAAGSARPDEPQLLYLSGTVLGTDGLPCVGACVFATTNRRQIAVTDAHGAFRLPVPAGAAVYLQADYFGLGSSRVAVDGQPTQSVRIVLGQ